MELTTPIMIVEDDRDDQAFLHKALADLQIDNPIVLCHNGVEALTYLTSGEPMPFLIISDINMPLMNGIQFRKRLIDDERLKKLHIPFVFLTTAGDPVTVSIAYKLSVQGFFEKSHTFSEFREQISQIINYWKASLYPKSVAQHA